MNTFAFTRTFKKRIQKFLLNTPFLYSPIVKIEKLIGTGFYTKTHLRNVSEAYQFIFSLLQKCPIDVGGAEVFSAPLVASIFLFARACLFKLSIGTRPLRTVPYIWVPDARLEREKTRTRICIGGAVLEDTYNRIDVGTLKLTLVNLILNVFLL